MTYALLQWGLYVWRKTVSVECQLTGNRNPRMTAVGERSPLSANRDVCI